jgi:MerR-like DNA binding protein
MMRTRSMTRTSTTITVTPPHAQVQLSADELAQAVGIRRTTLLRLVHYGLVETAEPGASVFTAAAAARLKRMLRLRADLELDLEGAAIVVDLMERLERAEAELARVRERSGS